MCKINSSFGIYVFKGNFCLYFQMEAVASALQLGDASWVDQSELHSHPVLYTVQLSARSLMLWRRKPNGRSVNLRRRNSADG